MITFSGIRIVPGTKTVPTPMDIAVQMGRITRFGGAVWSPLLMHSVLVAELTWRHLAAKKSEDFDFQTFCWALLHDAHEVVTGEVPRPWKGREMKDRQHELDFEISAAYKVDLLKADTRIVKAMDERALLLEAMELSLPGFTAVYEKQELAGDHFPHIPEDEHRLAGALINSDFWRAELVTDWRSRPVKLFAGILEQLQSGDQVGAASSFRLMFDGLVGRFE